MNTETYSTVNISLKLKSMLLHNDLSDKVKSDIMLISNKVQNNIDGKNRSINIVEIVYRFMKDNNMSELLDENTILKYDKKSKLDLSNEQTTKSSDLSEDWLLNIVVESDMITNRKLISNEIALELSNYKPFLEKMLSNVTIFSGLRVQLQTLILLSDDDKYFNYLEDVIVNTKKFLNLITTSNEMMELVQSSNGRVKALWFKYIIT